MLNLDYNYTVNISLPINKRTPIRLQWLELMTKPLISDDVLIMKDYDLYLRKANCNSQVLKMEYLLRYLFSNDNIYISKGVVYDRIFAFHNNSINQRPTFLYHNETVHEDRYYLFNNFTNVEQYNFVVNIPNSLTSRIDEIKFYVDKYNRLGRTYKIKTF